MALFFKCLMGAAGLYALMICAVAIHEAGHALASWFVGLKLLSVRIGPLELRRRDFWSSRWLWTSWFGGLTGTSATSIDQRGLAARYIFTVLSGPLANLLVAGILLFLLQDQRGLSATVSFYEIGFNLFFALLSFIPVSGRQHDSDGKRLVQLLFQKKRRDALEARLTYSLRLAKFKRAFEVGDVHSAREQLSIMEKVSGERNVAVLVAISGHLREHLVSGESLADCKWEAPAAAVAKGNPHHQSTLGQS